MAVLLKIIISAVFFLAPAVAMLMALPLAAMLVGPDPRPLTWVHWLLASPVVIGVLCFPGYAVAVIRHLHAEKQTPLRRWWIRLSLLGALYAALVGMAGGYWMAMFFPPSLLSFISSLYLLRRFEGW